MKLIAIVTICCLVILGFLAFSINTKEEKLQLKIVNVQYGGDGNLYVKISFENFSNEPIMIAPPGDLPVNREVYTIVVTTAEGARTYLLRDYEYDDMGRILNTFCINPNTVEYFQIKIISKEWPMPSLYYGCENFKINVEYSVPDTRDTKALRKGLLQSNLVELKKMSN